MPEEIKEQIDLLLEDVGIGVPAKSQTIGIHELINEWFNPTPDLIRHLIVIQLIACLIVTAFLIITEGKNMTPAEGMFSIVFFLFLAAMSVAMHSRMNEGGEV